MGFKLVNHGTSTRPRALPNFVSTNTAEVKVSLEKYEPLVRHILITPTI